MTALQCILDACRTTKDGGWVVAFACGQDQVKQISQVSGLRDEPLYLVVMTEAEYLSSQEQR